MRSSITAVAVVTLTQAAFNHLGIRLTAVLLDFSGYWILLVSLALTIAMLALAGFANRPMLARVRLQVRVEAIEEPGAPLRLRAPQAEAAALPDWARAPAPSRARPVCGSRSSPPCPSPLR